MSLQLLKMSIIDIRLEQQCRRRSEGSPLACLPCIASPASFLSRVQYTIDTHTALFCASYLAHTLMLRIACLPCIFSFVSSTAAPHRPSYKHPA